MRWSDCSLVVCAVAFGGCDNRANPPPDAGLDSGVDATVDSPALDESSPLSRYFDAAIYQYEWTCTGPMPIDRTPLTMTAGSECGADRWPMLDHVRFSCPTVTSAPMRTDPDTNMSLPPPDTRRAPTPFSVVEQGSFRPAGGPTSFPNTLKVVAWNMEYTSRLDQQIHALTTHPTLRDADVYLVNEIDRCTTRNGMRRAARMLAEAIQGDYAYAIEFIELDIGREIGGDTGQAIVSRRPLTGVVPTCHSTYSDWFGSQTQPRLGGRMFLSGEVPIGNTSARVLAVHLESSDGLGTNRGFQVRELVDDAAAHACGRPIIAGGDYNSFYDGCPEHLLLRSAGFTDAAAVDGDRQYTHMPTRNRLDYIWSRDIRVTHGASVRDVTLSDHFPVWATFELSE